jgi:TP901 family phage tail tape measure protein
MSKQARDYVIRLSAEGAAQMKRDLKALGVDGEKSLKLIQRSAKPASDGLKGVDRAARGAKAGLAAVSAELPALQRLTRFLGTTALVGAMTAFARSSVDAAKSFQASMKRVEAVTQAGSAEIEALTAKALEMGAKTAFTASQSADAIEVLAKNGLSVSQILDGALDSTLLLAGGLGADLAPSADLVTDLMQQFRLEASQLPAIVDAVTGAALTSKFSFDDLRLAIGQAGGVAGGAGVEINDFLTALSASASAFSSGQDAGTSFKTFVQRLVPQSKQARVAMSELNLEFFDATGAMKPMADVAEELKRGLSGLSEEARAGALQTIFGTDAIRTAIMLAEVGGDGFRDLAAGIGKVSAQEQAEVRLEGLEGALKELAAAWEALQLEASLNGGLDLAEATVERFTAVLRFLTENFEEVEEVVERVARALVVLLVGRGIKLAVAQAVAMRAVYIELASSVAGVGTAAGRALGPLQRVTTAGRVLTRVLGGPLSLAITAASLLSLGLDADSAADAIDRSDRAADDAADALRSYADATRSAADEQDRLDGKVSASTSEMVRQGRVAMQMALEEINRSQGDLMSSVRGDAFKMESRIFGIARAAWVQRGSEGIEPVFDAIEQRVKDLGPVFEEVFEALGDAREGGRSFKEIAALLNGVAGAGQEVTEAIGLLDDAVRQVEGADMAVAREGMVALAREIGVFDDQLEAIDRASSEFELLQAFEDLRTAMNNAVLVGGKLRETGEDGLLSLITQLAEGEKEGDRLRRALEGALEVLTEDPGETFVKELSEDAKAAADELERMGRAYGPIANREALEAGSTDRGAYSRSEVAAAEKGILDLIAHVEGTDKGRGYNETLDYGAYTGGSVNLINMTLREVLALQKQMLAHPGNHHNSSAVGRYQIVGTTLGGAGLTGAGGLIQQLGLSLDDVFDAALQDRLAMELIRGRRGQGKEGFYKEWEGFKTAGTPWSTIQTGLGAQPIPRMDSGVKVKRDAELETRRRVLEQQEEALRSLIEAGNEQAAQLELETSLIGKSAGEQARLTYLHEALTAAKRAGINVDQQLTADGERLIDVINRRADAIGRLTEEQRKNQGLSDGRDRELQESKDAVKSAFDELKRGGDSWRGAMDRLIDHIVDKLWEAAFDPVWDALAGLLNDFLGGLLGGLGGGIGGGILNFASGGALPKFAGGGDLQLGGRAAGHMRGRGHRRQDNILFWGSSDEFIQPGDAVEYYGADFMEAIRQKRLPKYADGGFIGGGSGFSPAPLPAIGQGTPLGADPVAPAPGGVNLTVNVTVENPRGNQEIQRMVEQGIEAGLDAVDANFAAKVGAAQNDPRVRR